MRETARCSQSWSIIWTLYLHVTILHIDKGLPVTMSVFSSNVLTGITAGGGQAEYPLVLRADTPLVPYIQRRSVPDTSDQAGVYLVLSL